MDGQDNSTTDPAARIAALRAEKERLLATAPQRKAFPSKTAYEEAQGYWRFRQGKNVALIETEIKRLSMMLFSPEALAPSSTPPEA